MRIKSVQSVCKRVDALVNAVKAWLDSNPHSRWLTYSWLWSLVGRVALRADYTEFTATRYAKNVAKGRKNGFIPNNWNELKVEYHLGQLVEAGMDSTLPNTRI